MTAHILHIIASGREGSMRMYRDSTAALEPDEIEDEISGVHAAITSIRGGSPADEPHPAFLLETICSERGHPQSSLCEGECLCGLTRYD